MIPIPLALAARPRFPLVVWPLPPALMPWDCGAVLVAPGIWVAANSQGVAVPEHVRAFVRGLAWLAAKMFVEGRLVDGNKS